ncbi:MAG: hypothetical protein ACLQDL_03910, partial [Spirochaetia bacterium]
FLMRRIHEEFYYPIAYDTNFQQKAHSWMATNKKYPWDTSILKIIDNLVIGAVRKRKDAA